MQTREAEAVETKVTVATEEKEREEVESQKEKAASREAQCGVWLLRCVCVAAAITERVSAVRVRCCADALPML